MPLPAIGWLVRLLGGAALRWRGWLTAFKWSTPGKWVWFYLFFYLGGLIGKVLWTLGVSVVANNFVTPHLTNLIASQFLGMPAEWVGLIGILRADQAMTVILSAVAVRAASNVSIKKNPAAPNWTTTG